MKNLNYKNLMLVYHDSVCRLYLASKDSSKKPIIFINDQIDHRLQAIETFTNITKKSCYHYSNTYTYNENVHTPYIYVYDYPIIKSWKEEYDTKLFATSLNQAIEMNNLEGVDIMGTGLGGILAIRASINPRVDKVLAVHSPIFTSPLANFELLKSCDLNIKRKALLLILKAIINDNYGFQKENAYGYYNLEENANLDKVTLVGSAINESKNLSSLERELANWIYDVTGLYSDGVVCFDEVRLKHLGFNVVSDDTPTSHFQLNSKDYALNNYNKFMTNR